MKATDEFAAIALGASTVEHFTNLYEAMKAGVITPGCNCADCESLSNIRAEIFRYLSRWARRNLTWLEGKPAWWSDFCQEVRNEVES